MQNALARPPTHLPLFEHTFGMNVFELIAVSLTQLDDWVAKASAHGPGWVKRHKTALGLGSVAFMVLTGASAIAVSNAPDPADLPVRQVLQAVSAPMLTEQVQELDAQVFRLTRTDTTRSNDTADALLARLGVSDAQAAQFMRTDALTRSHVLGRGGRLVQSEATDDGRLQRLVMRWSADDDVHFRRLTVLKTPLGFQSRMELAPLVATQRLGSGTIRSSLFAATDDARMPDRVAVQLAEIFSGDIDFHRSLRKGDRFHVVYEALEADGEPLRSGRVLSAEFVNNGKAFGAIWFQEPGANKGAYYTAAGESLRKAYLASPLEFSRITSGFKMRFHPIAQKWRAHLGVDYAAPTGTPARTVGDGVVDFAGWQGGYGNVVIVKHRSGHTTLYAHLSRLSVRKGQAVSQGETVGLVGSTGWSTGPHLHFEFRVDGVHKDPLTLAKQNDSVPLGEAALALFKAHSSQTRGLWESAASVAMASAQ